ncbi:MAG: PucR family transcriptional regulator, partial [Nocardiopsis sp. BM-2018]
MNTESRPTEDGASAPTGSETPQDQIPPEHTPAGQTLPEQAPPEQIRAETVRRLERSMGVLGTAAVSRMEEKLGWFRRMSAQDRSWIGLVAQSGVAAFVDWFRNPERGRPAITVEVFGTAPRELTRSVSLQQT